MTALRCAFHKWVRFAFAADADVWKCSKCKALTETKPGAASPPAAAAGKA